MDGAVNFTQLVVWGSGGLIMVLGYFLRGVMDIQKDHTDQLHNLHEKYVKKDDFKEFKEELWAKLDDLKIQIKDK
jgi:hypothetical protein